MPSLRLACNWCTRTAEFSAASNVEENLVLAGLTAAKPLAAGAHLRNVSAAGRSAAAAAAPICRAASNKCWRSRARSCAIQKSFCWTSRSKGLAPVIVRDLMKACRDLAAAGQTIVLVEQNLAATLALAQRVYIINNGHIVARRAGAGNQGRAGNPAAPSRRLTAEHAGRLFLHRAGHCRDIVLDKERVEDDERQRADHRARHQRAPAVDIAVDQRGHDRDRHGLVLRR